MERLISLSDQACEAIENEETDYALKILQNVENDLEVQKYIKYSKSILERSC